MTEGQIWQVMLKLKIFTPWMVLKEINPPSYLKQYIKEKIRSLITSQVKNGILEIYSNNPPVFGLPNQDLETIKRTCGVCGNRFIPRQDSDQYCSEECEKQYRKKYLEERRRQKGMAVKRRYSKEEEKLILDTISKHGLATAILQELSKKLGRHPESIKSKYKHMKKMGGVL
jgi:predicted nucleic acid-binding Zn ribbon protein